MKRWPTRPLGELGDLRGGGTPSRKVSEYFQGDIPWITGADVTDLYVCKAREFITKKAIEHSATTLLPKNTVLVVSRTGVGKIGIAATPLCASQDLTGIICGNSVLPEYLARCLLARADSLTRAAQGATIRGITRQFLSRVEIPVPPLAEQERIVKLLDEADELRKLRAQADTRTAQLIPALFHEMFGSLKSNPKGWPVITLGELIAEGPQNGLYKPSTAYGEGIPILRIDAFYDGVVTVPWTELKRLQVSDVELARYRVSDGDIVVNRVNSGNYLGKSALIESVPEPTVFESNMMRFSFDAKRAGGAFLIHVLQTAHFRHHVESRAKRAIGQSSINQSDLKMLPLPLPPLALQKEFAARVAEIRVLESAQAASRHRLEALFQSLLHRAFNGEL
jgi:type I restriction enzyme S subunit